MSEVDLFFRYVFVPALERMEKDGIKLELVNNEQWKEVEALWLSGKINETKQAMVKFLEPYISSLEFV